MQTTKKHNIHTTTNHAQTTTKHMQKTTTKHVQATTRHKQQLQNVCKQQQIYTNNSNKTYSNIYKTCKQQQNMQIIIKHV